MSQVLHSNGIFSFYNITLPGVFFTLRLFWCVCDVYVFMEVDLAHSKKKILLNQMNNSEIYIQKSTFF